jgi:hypothetical protein
LYPRTKALVWFGFTILWFWSCPPTLESGFRSLQTTILKGLFSYLVYTFGGFSTCHPSKLVRIGTFPWGGVPKQPKLSTLSYFSLCGFNILSILIYTSILFNMCRIIFMLHLNPYFVTVGIALWGLGPL